MSDKRHSTSGKKRQDIDAGLNGLFDALGQAIGEIASKLEDGKSGAISRDHVFETEKGPMRAHAGIRLRMGGLEVGDGSAPKPQPVNRNPAKTPTVTPSPTATPETMPLSHDLFEDHDTWVLTADMPGVLRKEIKMLRDGPDLILRTNGARRYHAQIHLSDDFELSQISVSLRNGILALKIPKVPV